MFLDDSHLKMSLFSSVCSKCKHLELDKLNIGVHQCKAFDSIPKEIWEGKNDHQKPFPGDKGVQFETR